MIDTSITDIAFEDAQMECTRTRSRQRLCETCAHDGCCEDLPDCGGTRWQNAMSTCPNCGKEFRDEGDWQSEDGHSCCSEACLGEWESSQAEEELGDICHED